MSGTSLDGLDLVYSKFIFDDDNWAYEILDVKTVDYDDVPQWKTRLLQAPSLSPIDLEKLNEEYAAFLGSFREERTCQTAAFMPVEADFSPRCLAILNDDDCSALL